MFNIKEELAQLNLNTGFWCCACLSVKPIKERSEDPRYCQTCWQIIKAEERLRQKPIALPLSRRKKGGDDANSIKDTPKQQKRRIKRGDNVNKKVARQKHTRS